MLFLQGGASLQFSMVPMNLLTPGATADYIDTGSWAEKAIKEAKKVGTRQRRGDRPRPRTTRACRAQAELKLTPGAAYVHMTSNNTIEGTEWQGAAATSATCRSSATPRRTCSAGRSTSRSHALIYAGAQKNLGPAGVTVVIIRDDLLRALARRRCRRC